MGSELSKFESLIGDNLESFKIMVEGALKKWDGIYDIILLDRKDYLIRAKSLKNFSPYCQLIRSTPKGEDLCFNCDINAAIESGKHSDEGLVHICDGGLLDIAAPIIVKGEVIAAILCGQARSDDEELEAIGIKQTSNIEQELSISPGELVKLRQQLLMLSLDQMNETARRLAQMTKFVSKVIEAQVELTESNTKLRRIQKEQSEVIQRLQRIEEYLQPLFNLQDNIGVFWSTLDNVLRSLSGLLGAVNAACLIFESDKIPQTTIRSIVNLPQSLSKGMVLDQNDLFQHWERLKPVRWGEFKGGLPGTLCYYLDADAQPDKTKIVEYLTIQAELSDTTKGLLIFFFDTAGMAKAEIEKESTELVLMSSRIAQAYNNTITYIEKVEEERQRREWIKRIEHQVISPLNGVLGHAGRLLERFDDNIKIGLMEDWLEEDISGWYKNFYALIDTADWTVTLTRNLTWMADLEKSKQAVIQGTKEVISDVPKYLIECARYFQGIAHDYKLRVHVRVETVEDLNERLYVYPDYFRMAIQNLLDNAVKYSDENTEISVIGEATDGHGRIIVKNIGLQISPEDCRKIFDYGYRSEAAKSRRRPGTGIGLSIAQEIIRLHEGSISAQPSKFKDNQWATEITITLPIIPAKK